MESLDSDRWIFIAAPLPSRNCRTRRFRAAGANRERSGATGAVEGFDAGRSGFHGLALTQPASCADRRIRPVRRKTAGVASRCNRWWRSSLVAARSADKTLHIPRNLERQLTLRRRSGGSFLCGDSHREPAMELQPLSRLLGVHRRRRLSRSAGMGRRTMSCHWLPTATRSSVVE